MFNRLRIDKRLVVDSTLFGLLLTLLVAAVDAFGGLSALERWFYDQRALYCQRAMPRPTDRLVHVDIDDNALQSIGRWPWHRTVLADVLDEIHLAGAKAVGLDVLLSEREDLQYDKTDKAYVEIDHDRRLADSIGRSGNVLVAARLPFEREHVSQVFVAMRDLLAQDPSLEEKDILSRLRRLGHDGPGVAEEVGAGLNTARQAALFDRIKAQPEEMSADDVQERVLPGIDPFSESPLLKEFQNQFDRVKAVREFRRFAVPAPADARGGRPRLFESSLSEPPIVPFSAAASAGGFVDYLQDADGRVRSVPLFMEADGKVYAQFGLALACRFLGVDPGQIRVNERTVVIPRPGGQLIVPVKTVDSAQVFGLEAGREVPVVADVSWFGGTKWIDMYARPGTEEKNQHVSIARVWLASRMRGAMMRNNRRALQEMRRLAKEMPALTPELRRRLDEQPPADDDVRTGVDLIDAFLAEARTASQAQGPAGPRNPEFAASLKKLGEATEMREPFETLLRDLRSRFEGKAVLVGWIATASIADFLPTSLHSRCPGVVMHGAIFNQIITGEVWRTLPKWVTLLVTLALGVITTMAVSFLSPGKAAFAAGLLAAGYLALNGFTLFDRFNLILGAAGPTVAMAVVWSGGTLAKLGMERYERARITRRFRSYADPKLVDYVLKHPEQNLFEGQVRELTVVYVDLVGFTNLTERMGPEAVQVLNELWSTLIPVIKSNDAYVNKFLGDGLMFFYGAPEQSPHHARDAVSTVLSVRKALVEFNGRAAERGWPRLALRFGISTGSMVVGDAGAPRQERADYTVIGDYANLGARLESANKAVGTVSLMTDRTVELAGDGFLFRPVGKLCVVGKQTAVMTYEVLARLEEATVEQKRLAADTKNVVEYFLAGRLPECLDAVERMEAAHGRSKLTALYRERCEYFLADPALTPFDCQITLSEK